VVLFKAVTLATFTLYQRELYFLSTHTEDPKDVTTSSDLLLIENRCHQHFLQSVLISFCISFLSSADSAECIFVTILWISALHGTVLSGYFLQNFIRYFFHEKRDTTVACMNNVCSTQCFMFHNTANCMCEYLNN
jgi:hypothetical protein